jgi:hypothetical protein
MMTLVQLRQGRSWWAAIIAVLGIACAFALQSADQAKATEYQYCWGKELSASGPILCEGVAAGYIYTVYANGMGGPICAGVGFSEGMFGVRGCNNAANEGLWVENIGGKIMKPFIYTTSSGPGINKVYGKYWTGEAPPPPPPPPAPTWHNDNLGGSLTSDPDISSWGTNRLDVFARGTEGSLLTTYFSGTTWSSWVSLGGSIVGGPSAVSMSSGRLDVVARTANNSIEHRWFDGSWHSDNLGGSMTSDPDIASWGPGRLDVFARGPEGALWTKYFNGSTWSSWINLGGSITGGPGAVAAGTERLHVVARDAGNSSIDHWWFAP